MTKECIKLILMIMLHIWFDELFNKPIQYQYIQSLLIYQRFSNEFEYHLFIQYTIKVIQCCCNKTRNLKFQLFSLAAATA